MDRRSLNAARPQNVRVVEPQVPTLGRTVLGRRLRELRRQIVAEGQFLMDWDDLEKELRVRRGDD